MSIHLIVSGHVQGVWFRAGAREQALQLGLRGWAINCPDGTVEIHVEGEKETLDKFISWCRKGPSAAQVCALDIEYVEPQGFTTFEIR